MPNLRYKLEALLFSSARSMKIEELVDLTKSTPEEVREKLDKLKKQYEERDSSIALIDEGNSFKLTVKSEHIPIIQQIVTETELSKTLMETLAVIAFKYPIKQSDLIRIRTNKAYDHLHELEEMGYITRQRYGRTKLIKLTPKFFDYFDLPPDKLKEKFADFHGIANAIQEKEAEVKKIKDDIKRKAKEEGRKKKDEPEVDLIDEEGNKRELEVYKKTDTEIEEEESKGVKEYKEKIGNLEVTDIPEEDQEPGEISEEAEEILEKAREEAQDEKEGGDEGVMEETQPGESEDNGGHTEEEKEDSDVDKEVDRLMHPGEEGDKGGEEGPIKEEGDEGLSADKGAGEGQEEGSDEGEPKDLLEAAAEEEKKKSDKEGDDDTSA